MSNPLLDELIDASVIPQVDIALPTRGYFYPQGEVLAEGVNVDSMPIHPLSVLEESTFNDPLLMLSGHAIAKLIKRVAPQVLDPARLCELDVQAILIAARIASHGPTMDVEHLCAHCGKENKLTINLNDHIMKFGSYTPEQFNEFMFELPRVGQTVMLRPMLYGDSVDMTMTLVKASTRFDQIIESRDKDDVLNEEFIDAYKAQFDKAVETNIGAVISSIYYVETKSGTKVFEKEMIDEWIKMLPPEEVQMISERIKTINDDIRERSILTYNCQHCGEENRFMLELDPQKLFTQAETSETPKESSAKSKSTGGGTKKVSKQSQRLR